MQELKPCPFCGGEAVYSYEYIFGATICAFVKCGNCDARTGGVSFSTEQDAAKESVAQRWNRRTETRVGIYDKEETVEGCTVQILTNTITGGVVDRVVEKRQAAGGDRRDGRMTYEESIEQVKNARLASEVRDALIAALEHIGEAMNVDRPTNCPNCGAAISGKTVNCEYCGTLLIWKKT